MDKLTRRSALGLAGAAGTALFLSRTRVPLVGTAPASAAGTATVTPSMTEGPYWIDELLRRADVRAAQPGVPLALTIRVLDAATGAAIDGAHVDIWHANAYGLYSDEAQNNTKGQTFLRGYQITGVDGASGQVGFTTIWPGWYSGRAIHIHVRVRTYDGSVVATNYTTQIFFSDKDNNAVLTGAAPYSTRTPQTDPTTDETDNILGSAVATNVVPVTGSIGAGFAATFTIYLSGVASSTVAAGELSASLGSVRVVVAKSGARSVAFSVRTGSTVTASAKLVRGAKVLGRATGRLTAGKHSLSVAVPASVASGAATLRLTLTDASGKVKAFNQAVHVPALT